MFAATGSPEPELTTLQAHGLWNSRKRGALHAPKVPFYHSPLHTLPFLS